MTEKVTIIGAGRDDKGPKGLIVRYIEAAVAQDEDAFRACLTEKSREFYGVEQTALEGSTITIGDVIVDGELFIVPSIAVDDADPKGEPFDFVVREENGELLMDMPATMERAMGMTQEAATEQMVEKMAGGLETMMEGTVSAMSKGLENVNQAMDKLEEEVLPVEKEEVQADLQQGQWILSQEVLADFPEQILTAAYAVGRFMTPPFSPPMQELDTEQYGTEESQVKTTRYGDSNQGFSVTESAASGEGYATHSVAVSAYGDPQGRQISAVWTKSQSGDYPSSETVAITAFASEESLKAVESFLSEEIGIQG